MKVYFETIEELCSSKVDIYTVQIGDNELFEFEKYYQKEFPEHREERDFIDAKLEEIKERGALQHYFRFEENAVAMPNAVPQEIVELNRDDQGIRLYGIRLSSNVLILLNGDIKTNQNPRECPNVRNHFLFANRLAVYLTNYIQEERIDIVHSKQCFSGLEIEI
ncbi:MAG: hypothetical protein GXC73_12540 [Chitinophagaceae bacterium]|nr:hypothetical protein [Chitinophagaceae bacterium]